MGSAAIQHALWRAYGRLVNRSGEMRKLFDAHGIIVFVGPNGSGKSLLLVEATLSTLDGRTWDCRSLDHRHNLPVKAHCQGCAECVIVKGDESFCSEAVALFAEHGHGEYLVYSTLPLLDETTGREHRLYRALTRIPQLPFIEHALVLFDEVAGVSDAGDSATMPAALKRWLQQLRKRDCRLFISSPAYKRCSLPIRQVATLVVDCRSFFKYEDGTGRQWKPRRAVFAEAYDAFGFADFDKNTGERLETLARWAYWRTDHRAMRCYETTAQVNALIDIEEGGACSVCNGSRSRPTCGCTPEVYEIPIEELEVVTVAGPKGGRVRKAQRVVLGQEDFLSAAPPAGGQTGGFPAEETRPMPEWAG